MELGIEFRVGSVGQSGLTQRRQQKRSVCSGMSPIAASFNLGISGAKIQNVREIHRRLPAWRSCFGTGASRRATVLTPAGRWMSVDTTAERSPLVNREVVLFLFQLEMDSQLQRALTYEDFDLVKDLRARRNKVDEALLDLQKSKGYGCGSRRTKDGVQFNVDPEVLSVRARLSKAIEEESYSEAAQLRDRLAELEEESDEADMPCPIVEPQFSLGQMVIHSTKGYTGVVCGWDLACCESEAWKKGADVASLKGGEEQVFYHILVDVNDWPMDEELAPVAYVAEELLDEASLANFESEQPLVNDAFQHPYSYLMFLGSDGHGNRIPCRQLRERYCVDRKDVYPPGHEDSDSDFEEEDHDDNDGPGGGGGDRGWGGGPNLPGIDMRSLE